MGLGKAYLVAYNALQFVGWSILTYRLLPHVVGLKAPSPVLYESVGGLLRCVQTAAFLEAVHAAVGLVRSNPMLTAIQISSRVGVLWGVLHQIKIVQTSIGFPLMLTAWCITEIIRYSYYTLNLLEVNIKSLTWLRYTLFIVLYPIGVTGELLCYYVALPVIQETKLFALELPNSWNFSFHFHAAVILIMVSYIPIFPQLYFHMFAQRKKVLVNDASKKQS